MTGAVPITLGQKALFIPHSGFAKINLSKIDRFAELLSNEVSVAEAARAVGWQPAHGNAMLQRIRKRLGPQAV